MDYLQIGNLSFERNASKSDMRLDFCSAFQEAALDCGDLAFDTLEAEVFTNTVGPQLSALAANIPVVVYRNNAVYARFVKLTVSRIAPNSYRITGRSPMGALTAMSHAGGIYTGQTANDIITEICGDIPILVESVYSNMKLYGWLPYANGKEKSARDNLTQVLFAIGAYLRTDLNGVLRVEKAWGGTASTIPADRSYSGGTINYDLPVSSVSVAEHQYVAGTDEKELFSGTAQAGDIVTFSEPMHSLTAEGFTVLESNANYARLSAGTGTLTGKTYIHNTRLVTRTVTAGAAENVVSVTDATLVSLVNSAAVANRLAEYYKHRETISNGVIAGAEKPGHVVSIYHPYDKKMVSACVESLDTTMSATLKSNLSALVGFIPPQPETSEYYDERVVLTGSGTWTVPEGTAELRVVVIGKGQDGTDGSNGGASIMTTQVKDGSSGSFSATSPGLGGDGGVGGTGGKILEETINVTAGQEIQYAAADNSDDSTFGSMSSANGASSDTGYYDTATQTYFGRKGADGKKGGNGGSPGNDGQAVGNFRGGYGLSGKTDTDTSYGFTGQGSISGWGGGGAAQGSLGGQSGGAFYVSLNGRFNKTDPSQSDVMLGCGYASGGGGANGANGKNGENYGDGGGGGHGGGGAGAIGTISLSFSPSGVNPRVSSGEGAWGVGGSAGTGGSGKPGCIIIYYRRPKIVQGGWVKDKNGKLLCERLGRRFIV